jgi:predicted flap endonuclease-1-like 5' DNA nuclease
LFAVLGFFLLMVIVGWWVSSRKTQIVEVVPETHVPPTEHTAVDDLVRLEGIGPKVAKVLNEAGITSFAALAAASSADIQKILSHAGLQMMNPEGWIEQAKLAAQGDWTSLEKLQGELRGGRKR